MVVSIIGNVHGFLCFQETILDQREFEGKEKIFFKGEKTQYNTQVHLKTRYKYVL